MLVVVRRRHLLIRHDPQIAFRHRRRDRHVTSLLLLIRIDLRVRLHSLDDLPCSIRLLLVQIQEVLPVISAAAATTSSARLRLAALEVVGARALIADDRVGLRVAVGLPDAFALAGGSALGLRAAFHVVGKTRACADDGFAAARGALGLLDAHSWCAIGTFARPVEGGAGCECEGGGEERKDDEGSRKMHFGCGLVEDRWRLL